MSRGEHTYGTDDEVCTPPSVWRLLEDTLGRIDLDPCGHPDSTVRGADRTIRGDGLTTDWRGHTYVNPPYSDAGPWITRARRQAARHGVVVTMLLPVRPTNAEWQREIFGRAAAICWLPTRIAFRGGHGAPWHSAIVCYGARDWTPLRLIGAVSIAP